MKLVVILTFTVTLICVLDMVLGSPFNWNWRHRRPWRKGHHVRRRHHKTTTPMPQQFYTQQGNNLPALPNVNNGQPIPDGGGIPTLPPLNTDGATNAPAVPAVPVVPAVPAGTAPAPEAGGSGPAATPAPAVAGADSAKPPASPK